jgi:hypothetical protein
LDQSLQLMLAAGEREEAVEVQQARTQDPLV